jgi:pyrimidine deaminase RibD-like protein
LGRVLLRGDAQLHAPGPRSGVESAACIIEHCSCDRLTPSCAEAVTQCASRQVVVAGLEDDDDIADVQRLIHRQLDRGQRVADSPCSHHAQHQGVELVVCAAFDEHGILARIGVAEAAVTHSAAVSRIDGTDDTEPRKARRLSESDMIARTSGQVCASVSRR